MEYVSTTPANNTVLQLALCIWKLVHVLSARHDTTLVFKTKLQTLDWMQPRIYLTHHLCEVASLFTSPWKAESALCCMYRCSYAKSIVSTLTGKLLGTQFLDGLTLSSCNHSKGVAKWPTLWHSQRLHSTASFLTAPYAHGYCCLYVACYPLLYIPRGLNGKKHQYAVEF